LRLNLFFFLDLKDFSSCSATGLRALSEIACTQAKLLAAMRMDAQVQCSAWTLFII